MGYTNYWIRTEKPITQDFVNAVKSIIAIADKIGISIRDGYGENKPIVTLDEVNFNGNAEKKLDHENFLLTNEESERGFNFCKTAEKPYDWVVKKVLAAAKEEGLVENVSDDGEVEMETDATYLIPKRIVRVVRQTMGLDADDYTRDKEIACMSHRELFDAWLTWNGIIGYTGEILNTIETIYSIALEEE